MSVNLHSGIKYISSKKKKNLCGSALEKKNASSCTPCTRLEKIFFWFWWFSLKSRTLQNVLMVQEQELDSATFWPCVQWGGSFQNWSVLDSFLKQYISLAFHVAHTNTVPAHQTHCMFWSGANPPFWLCIITNPHFNIILLHFYSFILHTFSYGLFTYLPLSLTTSRESRVRYGCVLPGPRDIFHTFSCSVSD